VLAHAKALEPGAGTVARVARRRTACAKAKRHVLESGEMRKEQVVLEDDTDRATLRLQMDAARYVVEDDIVELHATGVQRDQPGDGSEKRGLSGAIRSEHRDDLARRGFDRDIEVERPKPKRDIGSQHQNARR
jgi:hypothetical protein